MRLEPPQTHRYLLSEKSGAASHPVACVAASSEVGGASQALSLAQSVEVDVAKLRENYGVQEVSRRGIPSARESDGACVLRGQHARAPLRCASGRCFLGLARRQLSFVVAIEDDDNMIGDRHFQAGFKFSAEDFPVRLSATIS